MLSLSADCSLPILEFGLGHRTLFVSWHVVRSDSVLVLSLVLKRTCVSTHLVDLCHHHEKNDPGLLAGARCIKCGPGSQTCLRHCLSWQSVRISDWCVSHWDFLLAYYTALLQQSLTHTRTLMDQSLFWKGYLQNVGPRLNVWSLFSVLILNMYSGLYNIFSS